MPPPTACCWLPHPGRRDPGVAGRGPALAAGAAEDGGYTIIDSQRGQTSHFASTGTSGRAVLPLAEVTDRGGHRIDLDYTGDGTLIEIRHSGGHRIGVENTGGWITALRLLVPVVAPMAARV